MTFAVINSERKTVMYTESASCIPDISELQALKKGGYKFSIDGKNATVEAVLLEKAKPVPKKGVKNAKT